jgi:hypothetical protein
MVGFLILGVTVAALCGGFSFGFNTIKLSQEDVRADQILVQKLESLRVYSWTDVVKPGFIATNFTAYYSNSNAVRGITYSGTMSISPFVPSASSPEAYSNTLKQVTATVTWFSGGLSHTRTMMTLFSTNGISTFDASKVGTL